MTSFREHMALRAARALVGPLVLVGFFLPWADGPGPIGATSFSGFGLVGFAGRLQALDLAPAEGAALWMTRLAILGVSVAAAWQTVLAPAHRWHALYAPSGWYLAGFAGLAGVLGALRSGPVVPPVGLALLMAGGALFTLLECLRQVSARGETRLQVAQPVRRQAE